MVFVKGKQTFISYISFPQEICYCVADTDAPCQMLTRDVMNGDVVFRIVSDRIGSAIWLTG